VSMTEEPLVPRELSVAELVAGGYHPYGWTASRWGCRLLEMALRHARAGRYAAAMLLARWAVNVLTQAGYGRNSTRRPA
jgi:hypothetical protein